VSREGWLAVEVLALMCMAWAPRRLFGGDPLVAGLRRTEWAGRIQPRVGQCVLVNRSILGSHTPDTDPFAASPAPHPSLGRGLLRWKGRILERESIHTTSALPPEPPACRRGPGFYAWRDTCLER
jgi:hypothetical protein